MLANNPLRNSRRNSHRDGRQGAFPPGALYNVAQTRPECGTSAQVYKM
jgi:hypothetical protein